MARVVERAADIRRRIAELTDRRVALVAVTKSHPAGAWELAAAAGCDAIAENYAQELAAKAAVARTSLPVHFIGRIQSNKVRSVSGVVDVWQSVDRASVAAEIARRAPGATVFVQVNLTGEPTKGGCAPEEAGRLVASMRATGLLVAGAMTLGPTEPSVPARRAAFRALTRIADDLGLAERSMGMSDDFEDAVAEGSTMVRVGSALFGPRVPDGTIDR
ncbi:MAG: YggS family pyridoxal phosphate-dependent enzyme [Acidobacteria bacterium]|nr:YggS family pyridoxal phosphate-dependent enzyme [Acidobacteriota bacterium]